MPSTTSTAYATLSDANAWFAARNMPAWAEHEDDARTAALLRASEWLDRYFAFAGEPESETQAMAWPRAGITSPDGRAITGIPDAVYEAVYMLALAMLDDDESAEAALGLGPVISSQKAGGVEITYAGEGAHASRIVRLLEPYLKRRESRTIRRS